MMKRLWTILLPLALLSSACLAGTNQNAVGYVKETVPGNGLVLVAVNFEAPSGPMTVSNLFQASFFPTGTTLIIWNGGAQGYQATETVVSVAGTNQWASGTNVLQLGQSVWIKAAGEAGSNYDFYVLGQVPSQTSTSLAIDSGISFISYPYPVDVDLIDVADLLAIANIGDTVWYWDSVNQRYQVETCIEQGIEKTWYPGTLVLEPGEGFIFMQRDGATIWSQAKPYAWP